LSGIAPNVSAPVGQAEAHAGFPPSFNKVLHRLHFAIIPFDLSGFGDLYGQFHVQ
jgi:hypothetical protein